MPSDIDALAEGLQLLEDEGLEQYATIDIVPTDEYAKALAATTPVAALLARAALADELEPWLSLTRSLDLRMERMRAQDKNALADITFAAEALSCIHGLAAALARREASK